MMVPDQTTAATSTVLVADDDGAVRQLIVEYLTAEGMDVVEADHGLGALLLVKRLRPRIVVLDLLMPRLDGLAALKRIRAFSPETAVIVITGSPNVELWRQASDLGAIAVLLKPFALRELRAIMGDPGGQSRAAADAGVSVPRILIADDEPDIRKMLMDLLAADGYAIHTAVDGARALTCVVEQRPDLVLLDFDLPGLRGGEALVAIRKLSPATRVIVMRRKTDVDEAKRALASGAFDYVSKPFDLAYLDRAIRTALLGVD